MAEIDRVAVKAASGGVILTVGNFAHAAISAVGSIVVARLLGPTDYGIVSIALIYPTMFSGLTGLGLSAAIMRYASLGDTSRALIALWLRAVAGALSAAALIPLSPHLAASLQRPYLTPMIYVLTIYTFASSAVVTATAFFAGVNRYWDLVLAYIVEAVARLFSSVVLVLAGYGVYGAVWGFSIGYSLAALYAFVRLVSSANLKPNSASHILVDVLSYSLPLYVSRLIGLLHNQFNNILRAVYVTDAEVGNFQVVGNLLTPVNIVTGSLSTALFTTLPQLVNEDSKFKGAVNIATRYVALVVAPIAVALALFSRQTVYLIYGSRYDLAPLYLSVMALSGLLAPFGLVTMYLNIVGATKTTMYLSVAGMVVGLPVTWIMLVRYGMLGAVVASVVSSALSSVMSLIVVKRRFGVGLEVSRVVRYWLPSLVSGVLTYLAMRAVKGLWLALGVGVAVYLVLLLLLVAAMVSAEDLSNLADISRGVKYVGSLINCALCVVVRVKAMLQLRTRS